MRRATIRLVTPGHFTPDGAARFAARFPQRAANGFYRTIPAGAVASLGLGSYLGPPDEATSARYVESMLEALRQGINVFDTAINYRYTRSEQDLGEALRRAFGEGLAARDEVLVASKAGFLTAGAVPSGIHVSHLAAGGTHCMHPDFLADQVRRSRAHLGVETIDVYYLHNPETQLQEIDSNKFEDRVLAAFQQLEKLCRDGQIGAYGIATWGGLRRKPGEPERLSLPRLAELAREAAGEDHHFRYAQLPVNLMMPEAFTYPHTLLGGEGVNVLEVAVRSGITVVASASLKQARLAAYVPAETRAKLDGPQTNAQFALQFTRSTPGVSIALAGMSQTSHVRENAGIGEFPPAPAEQWLKLFEKGN